MGCLGVSDKLSAQMGLFLNGDLFEFHASERWQTRSPNLRGCLNSALRDLPNPDEDEGKGLKPLISLIGRARIVSILAFQTSSRETVTGSKLQFSVVGARSLLGACKRTFLTQRIMKPFRNHQWALVKLAPDMA